MVVVVEEFYKFVYSLQRRIEEHCCQLFWRAYGHENLDSADVINVPQLNAEITHLREACYQRSISLLQHTSTIK
ncbi:hypothetical protein T4D_16293 [Trichinella pseudospiralis]|uniref:Uncharacterized protein n=1 Tax=Trichinella pseudospiralis TaxID=6337 RepID=A0A0V1FNP0_TRIPS|nr:hypothetical protein T4D_16293 [Trichinella pseudospiralis]